MGLSQSHEYSASEMGALTFLWLLRKIISEGQLMSKSICKIHFEKSDFKTGVFQMQDFCEKATEEAIHLVIS